MIGTIGEIRMFAGNFAPSNWELCHGQIMPINDDTRPLFGVIGSIYGGDGRVTFAMPDLQGRVPVGEGQGINLSLYHLGQKTGSAGAKMEMMNMPAHTHKANEPVETTIKLPAYNNVGDSETPGSSVPAVFDGESHFKSWDENPQGTYMHPFNAIKTKNDVNVDTVGAGAPFSTYAPYIAINYIICMKGQHPVRN